MLVKEELKFSKQENDIDVHGNYEILRKIAQTLKER